MKLFDDNAPSKSSTRADAIRGDGLPLVPGRAEARPSTGFGSTPKPNRGVASTQ